MTSFIAFTVIAIVAHILVWQWRPWLPSVNGYQSGMLLQDGLTAVKSLLA